MGKYATKNENYQTEWRRQCAAQIAREMDMNDFGVEALYLFGSVSSYEAGLRSDIDLIIHIGKEPEPQQKMILWFQKWEEKLRVLAEQYTNEKLSYVLDLHYVNNDDVDKGTSFAVKMKSIYDPPELLCSRQNM